MTPIEREYIEKLERRIVELERNRFARLTRGSLFVLPLLAIALLSGSTPGSGLTALESRVFELESRVRVGPSGSTQMRVPFQVIDGGGKVLFSVSDRAQNGAVNVTTIPGSPTPALRLVSDGGKEIANMVSDPNGNGRISNFDANGKLVAQFNPVGLNVFNIEETVVAGVTRGTKGLGRVAVWHSEKQTAAELIADEQGNGQVYSYGANGKVRAGMDGAQGLAVFDDNEKTVVSVVQKNGRGVLALGIGNGKWTTELTTDTDGGGLLHMKAPDGKITIGLYGGRRVIALGNSSGKIVAEMVVHPSGNGLFQVWGSGNLPLALLGKSVDSDGGILQISNGKAILSSLTASGGGHGLWQLNDISGRPVVEAGNVGGLGTIRVGPTMRCLPRPSSLVLPDCMLGRP